MIITGVQDKSQCLFFLYSNTQMLMNQFGKKITLYNCFGLCFISEAPTDRFAWSFLLCKMFVTTLGCRDGFYVREDFVSAFHPHHSSYLDILIVQTNKQSHWEWAVGSRENYQECPLLLLHLDLYIHDVIMSSQSLCASKNNSISLIQSLD